MKYRFAIFHLGKDLDSKNTSKGFFSTKVGQRNEPFAQSGRDWSLLETCLEQDLCFFSLVRLCLAKGSGRSILGAGYGQRGDSR